MLGDTSFICRICGCASGNRVIRDSCGGDYCRCRHCGYEMQGESDGGLRAGRFEAEQKKYYGSSEVRPTRVSQALSNQRVKRRVNVFEKTLRRGCVLEVGPGDGSMISALKSRGYHLTAVEHSSVLAKRIESLGGVEVMCVDFESVEVGDRRWDAVLSFHVIEHVADPLAHLTAAGRVVGDNGIAMIATPNADGLEHRILGRHSPNYSTAHLSLFTKKSLEIALKRSGWSVVKTVTPVYADAWLRAGAALVRAIRGTGGTETRRGVLGKSDGWLGWRLLWVFNLLTYPFRKMQEFALMGNEVLIIAVRRDER